MLALRNELKGDIGIIRADMVALENRLIIKLGALIAALFGAGVGIILHVIR